MAADGKLLDASFLVQIVGPEVALAQCLYR